MTAFKIISQIEEPVFSRKQIVGELSGRGPTLSRTETLKVVAKEAKADAALVVIKKIESHYGELRATVTAQIYSSKEQLESVAPKFLRKRGRKQESKKEEKEAEGKAEKKGAPKGGEQPKAQEKVEKAQKKPQEKKGKGAKSDGKEAKEEQKAG